MGDYDGKKVVITGGSSGLGLATAQLVARRGAQVVITGRDQDALERAVAGLGGGAVGVVSDASSLADVDALARRVEAELGSVDALFVNAGVNGFAPFESTTEEAYDQLFAVNAKGPYFTVQRLAPLMPAGSGVVLTTSVANVLGIPMISAYAASKAALRSMTRGMARELLPRGIRVNAVSPGAISTGALYKAMPREAADQTIRSMTADNPMGRFGEPNEVARAVAFLAFDATYTTGAELPVDGGGAQM